MAAAMVAVMGPDREVQHLNPVWRDRSNFIIAAQVETPSGMAREQLWARKVGDSEFELCCIPFFLYNVALGDLVRTAPAGGRTYMLAEVVRRSGRFVFRVWFGESFGSRDETAAELEAVGALLEWSSTNLLAIDAPDEAVAPGVANMLQRAEDLGYLMYETGRTA